MLWVLCAKGPKQSFQSIYSFVHEGVSSEDKIAIQSSFDTPSAFKRLGITNVSLVKLPSK